MVDPELRRDIAAILGPAVLGPRDGLIVQAPAPTMAPELSQG